MIRWIKLKNPLDHRILVWFKGFTNWCTSIKRNTTGLMWRFESRVHVVPRGTTHVRDDPMWYLSVQLNLSHLLSIFDFCECSLFIIQYYFIILIDSSRYSLIITNHKYPCSENGMHGAKIKYVVYYNYHRSTKDCPGDILTVSYFRLGTIYCKP